MPEVPTPNSQWQRALPASHALNLIEGFPRLLGTTEVPLPIPQYRAQLFDGTNFRAHTVDELRADLEGIPDEEIRTVDLSVITEAGHLSLESATLAGDPEYASTTLRGNGTAEQATVVHGAFAQAKQQVERAFRRIDREREEAAAEATSSPAAVSGFSVNVGGIGASVAVAGRDATTGPQQTAVAPARTKQPAAPESRWWNNPWVYTIVGGVLAAVFAAAVAGLFDGK